MPLARLSNQSRALPYAALLDGVWDGNATRLRNVSTILGANRIAVPWETDSELVARARGGDTEAFADLMSRHGQAVYRMALAALASPADAEEVVQWSFLRAYRKLDTFREESSFKTWVSAIAWKGALSRRRSLSLRWRRFVQPVEVAALEPVTCGPTSEEALIVAEQYRNTTRLIRALPTRLRDPLLLIATGEQSYKEMSAMLGVPEGTLKWRVSEARRLLREKLEKLGYSR